MQHIARRVAAGGNTEAQVDVDGRVAAAVVGDVQAVAANQAVGTRAAFEAVVAAATVEGVGTRVAAQHVAVARAHKVFHIDEGVAFGITARAGQRTRQIHLHRAGRAAVAGRV